MTSCSCSKHLLQHGSLVK